jgi:UDP-N-acetylglucosamine 2-epimerase (non-hydrolysing)
MRVVSVVGSRPQFVKLAAVAPALRAAGHEHVVIHTGQHYDRLLSEVFFTDLGLRQPDANLGVGAASHSQQTAAALAGLEPLLVAHRPDWVLVYGDTNATLAGALAATQLDLPLAHLEAGLRSDNRAMPEERNRVVVDHLADLLLAPTANAVRQLAAEGLAARAVRVGDVMVDVLAEMRRRVESEPHRYRPGFVAEGRYLVATIHRAHNTDDPARLEAVLTGLAACSRPVRLLAHPRLVARAAGFGLPLDRGAVTVFEPLPYPAMVAALLASDGLITDSGGLQKEAFLLGVACTTVRGETEWPETLQDGRNVLVDDPGLIAGAVSRGRPDPVATATNPYGDGRAAGRVVAQLASRVGTLRRRERTPQ